MKYLDKYLETKRKASDGSYNNIKHLLDNFKNSIDDKPIDEVGVYDIIEFLEQLDGRDIQYNTKRAYRSYLQAFFSYVEEMEMLEGRQRVNPVPSDKIFQFTQDEEDIERKEDEEDIYSKHQLQHILDYIAKKRHYTTRYKDRRLRDYLLFALEITTGARISEVRTIKQKDIDLDLCYYQTGFVKNARKTTLHSRDALVFFFPKRLRLHLAYYMKRTSSKWLFPGRSEYLTKSSADNLIEKFRDEVGFYMRWHLFRATLITYRTRDLKCPLWISEGLMNHAPSSIEAGNYINLTFEEKRKQYEEYDPYGDLKFDYEVRSID